MIIGNWQVKIQELPGRYSKALHIWRKVGDKYEHMQPNGEVKILEPAAYIAEPLLVLDEQMLQSLAEELTGQGYKPKDLGKVEGLYEAQTKHLEDLRHLLKIPKPIISITSRPINFKP